MWEHKIKSVVKFIFPLTLIKGHTYHKQLWDGVIKLIKSPIKDEVMQFIRSSAISMLRVSGKMSQMDITYIKCMKELSLFFGVQEESLDLMFDAIQGNPLDLIKV